MSIINEIHMQGKGYYNENCSLQEMAIHKLFSVLEPIDFREPSITFADYGSSEGKNATLLLQRVLEQLNTVSSATLVFNDTPSNDFNSLASTVQSNLSALSRDGKVSLNTLMVSKSYFQQVLPDGFVDAGFSFTALHWLQHMPDKTSEDTSSADKSLAAHNDLASFLSSRYKELRQGGTLTLCIPVQGPVSVEPAIDCMRATIQKLPDSRGLCPSIIDRLPLYFRTINEIQASIEVSRGGWQILEKKVVPIEHPAWSPDTSERSQTANRTAARNRYAKAITGLTLAACSSFLVNEVSSNDNHGYSNDTEFLGEFSQIFTREFLDSFCEDKVGFTYAFIRLRKV